MPMHATAGTRAAMVVQLFYMRSWSFQGCQVCGIAILRRLTFVPNRRVLLEKQLAHGAGEVLLSEGGGGRLANQMAAAFLS